MDKLNYEVDPKNNQLKYIRGTASEIKSDAEYTEAAEKAAEALEAIGNELYDFTDDFDIRAAYNQIHGAYSKLKMKAKIANEQ